MAIQSSNSTKDILAFGASLTAGWFTAAAYNEGLYHPYAIRLTQLLHESPTPNYKVTVEGVPGATTAMLLDHINYFLIAKAKESGDPSKPSCYSHVVILAGTNDLGSGVPVATTFANLEKLYRKALAHGAIVAAVTLPPSVHTLIERRAKLNDMIRAYSREHKEEGVVLVELHDKMPYLDKASDPMKLWDDGLHFAPAGYDRFGEIVFEALQGTL